MCAFCLFCVLLGAVTCILSLASCFLCSSPSLMLIFIASIGSISCIVFKIKSLCSAFEKARISESWVPLSMFTIPNQINFNETGFFS